MMLNQFTSIQLAFLGISSYFKNETMDRRCGNLFYIVFYLYYKKPQFSVKNSETNLVTCSNRGEKIY